MPTTQLLRTRSTVAILLYIAVVFLFSFASAQACSKSVPCQRGCCNEFGFCGLGPNYCSNDVCVNNCERKAECDPGGWGHEFANRTACPLNLCCSKYGFCGTTAEFCGKKMIRRPSCDVKAGQGFNRVVGYYEAWATQRLDKKFYPEQIPAGIYTHLIFAFVAINPESFELVPTGGRQGRDLYQRVAYMQDIDTQIRPMISVGGWRFNNAGPTAKTFSDLVRDTSAQRKFIKSVLTFFQTHRFAGLDINWQFPVEHARHGRAEDFENFPVFVRNMKRALKDYEVSVTLPASYQHLQHFDIRNLAPHVDFFNVMSYDLHGAWGRSDDSAEPYLNSHTNMTEIQDGLDLFWRNGINPDKITLGLAFYGRGFIATSPSCVQPGCSWESATGSISPRVWEAEIGVILNSEIDDLVRERGLTPTLDEGTAVKIITFDGDHWVTFDDGDTFKIKADFARRQCLGGVVVWAVSHDTRDANYSRALAKAAPRKYFPYVTENIPRGFTHSRHYNPQCQWSNCGEDCPRNWIRMLRKSKGIGGDEFMVDGTGCGGRGTHKLCCPPTSDIPECDWYSHRNGNFDSLSATNQLFYTHSTCPEGTREIARNNQYCHNTGSIGGVQKYQVVCCTTNVDSMKLYDQCAWAELSPIDNHRVVPDDEAAASSSTSSSPGMCYELPQGGSMEELFKRKYCCEQPQRRRWSDCSWHSGLSSSPSSFPSKFCHANCPSSYTRVALDSRGCADGSAKALCCKADYLSVSQGWEDDPVLTEEDEYFKEALEDK